MKLIKRWRNDKESVERILVSKVKKDDAALLEQLGYLYVEQHGRDEVWEHLLCTTIDLGFASMVCTPILEPNGEKELHIGLYRKSNNENDSKFYSLVSVCNHGETIDGVFVQEDGKADVLVWGPSDNRTDFDCFVMDPNWDEKDAEEANAEPIPEPLEKQPLEEVEHKEETDDASVFCAEETVEEPADNEEQPE